MIWPIQPETTLFVGRVVVIHLLEGKLATLVWYGAFRGYGCGCVDIFVVVVEGSRSMEFGLTEALLDGHGVACR
jgi:hypothetical protein